jgi:ribonucleoside-diphosphate reductase alpha chain
VKTAQRGSAPSLQEVWGLERLLMSAELTKNALAVLEARYLRRGRDGAIVETPAQLFERVARAVANAELLYGPAANARLYEERFHNMMASLDFLPNSPTLMNAGTGSQQLSACFVLPIEDNIESIFGTLRDMALVQRTGGGTGFSFSHLRPANDFIASTGGTASGPVSFMKIFDCATENIKQGGKRRGANMGVLRMDHPDIAQFINAKLDEKTLCNFNISVGVTDRFMKAAKQGADFPLLHPSDGRIVGSGNARWLFEAICEAAWQSGDPGLVFLDAIARGNSTPGLGNIECTNPCGEVPLLPYEACNLGSVNLAHMVCEVNKVAAVDWEKLTRIVHEAVRFLDDVISVNSFPLQLIEDVTLGNRKIGLGVMGFAELCILLGISYGSDDGLHLANKVMKFIANEALRASVLLAEERGPFPNWKHSEYYDTVCLRNATLTSIAPTGTIGIIAGTTSGIEPLFALAYRRTKVLNQQTLTEFNPLFLRYLEQRKLAHKDLLDSVAHYGTLKNDVNVPKDVRRLFNSALEITPEHHVRMQATFQKHVDNAVSKTVNLPTNARPADVGKVYRLAHELGCKGVTVFRYGSKAEGVLQLGLGESAHEREYFAKCDPGACRL